MIWLDQAKGWDQASSETEKKQQQNQLNLSQKFQDALHNKRNQIRIRDLHLMLRDCADGPCLNTVVSNYRELVHKRFGADVKATRLSRTPFFYAYNTPELLRVNSPWFADTTQRQTYLHQSGGDSGNHSKRMLVCVTATIPTLNMPLVMFHSYAHKFFDSITYLFDPKKDGYQTGNAEISDSVGRLVEQLKPETVGFLGVSSGAAMAIRLGQQHPGSRTVASSPVLNNDADVATYLTTTPQEELGQKIAILYANNATDLPYRALFESLNQTNNTIAHDLSAISPSHATLASTTVNGLFGHLMAWLNHSSAKAITAA